MTTQKHKILGLLWDKRYHSVGEIISLGIAQYNARIKELRDEGFTIVNERYKDIPDKYSIANKSFKEHKPDDTFFKLITPTQNIDYKNLQVKQGQMELL